MATVSENLTTLIGIKNDIKTAIINKGVEVGDDFNSYATAIGSISGGGSGLDYSGLGYSNNDISGANSVLQDSINIAKEIYNNWVPSSENTTLSSISRYINNDLIVFPLIDTSYVTSMNDLFVSCESLRFIPLLNTSSVKYMISMFEGCISLQSIPQLDTSSVIYAEYMFQGCSSLTTIPQLDTSSIIRMEDMFNRCSSLQSIPQLDTSSATNMNGMFANCTSLTTIPQLDTSSVKMMRHMFYDCTNLQSIPQLDTSSAKDIRDMFHNCYNLTDIGGFLDVKSNMNYDGLENISKQSWINIFTNLYDWNTNPDNLDPYDWNSNLPSVGFNGEPTITLSDGVSQIMSDSETIAIATNKGWTLRFS